MENASKALIMASGILISILILTLVVYLFIDFGSTASKVNSRVTQQQIAQANSKFTTYEGQEGLTIYDVITVASYARENNLYYKEEIEEGLVGYKIEVHLVNRIPSEIQDNIEDIKITLIENDKSIIGTTDKKSGEKIFELPTYKCEIDNYYESGKVHAIKFTKN